MISRVHSSILLGIDAIGCEVEADVTSAGETTVKLVGMAKAAGWIACRRASNCSY